ncbi:MAG TPA: AzlD domain-containing protein [Burkholderiales bacterium]|jgi:branched-subunit amino acid transport protein|nr:AzlD domain-containing protein [Burkholderiales bacterium]
MDAAPLDLWWLIAACGLGTYLWRGLGVLLSGRIEVESELFRWAVCVAYAMVAGLIVRIILMPTGMLATTLLEDRLIACAAALAAFYATRRNLFAGVSAGAGMLVALSYARAAFG